jgi:hypothetical protein
MENILIEFQGRRFIGSLEELPPAEPLRVVTEFELGEKVYQLIEKPAAVVAAYNAQLDSPPD